VPGLPATRLRQARPGSFAAPEPPARRAIVTIARPALH
jgi:hypothetical protein